MPKKFTREEFIEKAKIKYPDYDYSKVFYKNATTKIIVGCPIHGFFTTSPSKLTSISGYGCQKCGYEKSSELQRKKEIEFINAAKQKFPLFDYSCVNYVNCKTPVTVICKKHGKFVITPDSLINKSKYGCLKCALENNAEKCKLSTEEFIERVKELHPELDFTYVRYTKSADKVTVICKKHGEFRRRANDLLKSNAGCPKCGIEKRIKQRTKGQELFLREAKQKFPQFDYSKVKYKTSGDKVKIICLKHGEFFITPDSLLGKSKHGCPYCANEEISNSLKFTTKEFIEKVKQVHPNYDYSKIIYKDQNSKIIVICPKHGEFTTRAGNLLVGHGCPVCNAPKGELFIRNWLINHFIDFETQKKFEELGNLSYDFFIPSKNLLIEFNGEQHFGIVPFFHKNKRSDKFGVMGLRVQFQNDMEKKKYAQLKGYDLLVIPYWDFDKIQTILSEKLL